MGEDAPGKPTPPDLPKYLLDPLDRQPPDRLESVSRYAGELAEWKRREREREAAEKRAEEAVDDGALEGLAEREVSTDPDDYEDVPASGAYITIKETKPGYLYYYWQWREGDAWKNEYIAPVNPGTDSG